MPIEIEILPMPADPSADNVSQYLLDHPTEVQRSFAADGRILVEKYVDPSGVSWERRYEYPRYPADHSWTCRYFKVIP